VNAAILVAVALILRHHHSLTEDDLTRVELGMQLTEVERALGQPLDVYQFDLRSVSQASTDERLITTYFFDSQKLLEPSIDLTGEVVWPTGAITPKLRLIRFWVAGQTAVVGLFEADRTLEGEQIMVLRVFNRLTVVRRPIWSLEEIKRKMGWK
jgi:hypothetical protein